MTVSNVKPVNFPQSFALKNLIINGNFDYWQRGTSFAGQEYTADRWLSFANDSVTRQSFSAVPEISNAQYYLRKTPVQTGGAYHALQYTIENGGNLLSGKTVTLSFWARRNTASDYTMEVFSNLNNDQQTASTNIVLTGVWTKYIIIWQIPVTNGSNAHRYIRWNPQGDGRGFDLAQVQLEIGNVATEFSTAGITPGLELQLCQRYFTRIDATNGTGYSVYGLGYSFSSTIGLILVNLPTTMRTSPSLYAYGPHSYAIYNANGSRAVSSISVNQANTNQVWLQYNITSGVQGEAAFAQDNNGTGFLSFSAEL